MLLRSGVSALNSLLWHDTVHLVDNEPLLQVSKADYVEHGSEGLTAKLCAELEAQGKKPYVVPVGGSNSLGTWGYMMAMQEIMDQTPADEKFSHIVMVCRPACIIAKHRCPVSAPARRL